MKKLRDKVRPDESPPKLFDLKPIPATHHETVIGRLYSLRLPPTTYAVLSAVATHSSPASGWKSFPAYDRLMEVAVIGNRRTLSVHLDDLVKRGFLIKRRRRNKSTLYQLTDDLFQALRLRSEESLPKAGRGNSDTDCSGDTDTTSGGNTDTLINTTQQTPLNRHQLNINLVEDGSGKRCLLSLSDETIDPDSQWERKVIACRSFAASRSLALDDDEYDLVWDAYNHDRKRLQDALSAPEFTKVEEAVSGDF